MIYVMQIVNTHGVRGEVKALHYTDGEDFFKKVKTVYNSKKASYVDKKLTYGKNYFYKVKGIKYIDYNEKYTKLSAVSKGTPKLVAPAVKLSKTGQRSERA